MSKPGLPSPTSAPSFPSPLPQWLRAGGAGGAVLTTSINMGKPPQAFSLVEMGMFPVGFLWFLWDTWTQKMLSNESEMRAGKGREDQAYHGGRREIKGEGAGERARENTQLEERDVIKTTHISFHSCLIPASLAITFSSAFLAFFFLNWVYPNWYLVSFHPYQQLAVSKRLNGQNMIFPQAEWGMKFPFCLKQWEASKPQH